MRIAVPFLLLLTIMISACQKELSAPNQARNPDSTSGRWRVKIYKEKNFPLRDTTDADSSVYIATYDSNNRLIKLYDSVYGETQDYSYNANGKLAEVRKNNGWGAKFFYDASGRLERRLVTSYGYIDLPSYYSYTTSATGTTVKIVDTFRTGGMFPYIKDVIWIEYDVNGNLIRTSKINYSGNNRDPYITDYRCDADGNIISRKYVTATPTFPPGINDYQYTYTRRSDNGLVFNFYKQAFVYMDVIDFYNNGFINSMHHKAPFTSYVYNYYDGRTNQIETKSYTTNAVFDASGKLLYNSFVHYNFGGDDLKIEYSYTYEQY